MTPSRLIAVVGVVAAVTAGAAVAVVPHAVSFAPVVPVVGTGVPFQTLETYGVRGMHVVGYVHGGAPTVRLALENDGPLPVTVTTVELPGAVAPLLSLEQVDGLPVTLGPGERREVAGRLALGNCRFTHEREVETREELLVGWSSLGREGVQRVPFDRPVLVHSPMIVGCPERKLDRQAADRSDLTAIG